MKFVYLFSNVLYNNWEFKKRAIPLHHLLHRLNKNFAYANLSWVKDMKLFLATDRTMNKLVRLKLANLISPILGLQASDCIHNASCSSQDTSGPNKLERYISLSLKGLARTNTLACWVHLQVTMNWRVLNTAPSLVVTETPTTSLDFIVLIGAHCPNVVWYFLSHIFVAKALLPWEW